MSRTKVFKLGELFCGPGGLAWGAQHAQINNPKYRIEHVWSNDFDSSTCETYRANICPKKPNSVICEDVHKLDINSLGKIGKINAFAYGFPCNDFSAVGERKGFEGKYGPLYTYGLKVLEEYKPEWFIAENVSGLSSANEGNAFTKIMSDLKNAGYKLYPNLYQFEDYGIPQARHRIIIVGIRDDLNYKFAIPAPSKIIKTCKEAIENPPIPDNASNNEKTVQSERVIERLKHIKPGQNAFNADLPENLRLNIKGAKISQIYKRLDPTKPAYTVTGSGGGGTHIYHWKENRALTNRERARLQTFPDDFVFSGNKESVRKQIGMAVPAEGAKIIFEAILNTFAGIEYDSVEPNITVPEDTSANRD